jgi:hypothetical protein
VGGTPPSFRANPFGVKGRVFGKAERRPYFTPHQALTIPAAFSACRGSGETTLVSETWIIAAPLIHHRDQP